MKRDELFMRACRCIYRRRIKRGFFLCNGLLRCLVRFYSCCCPGIEMADDGARSPPVFSRARDESSTRGSCTRFPTKVRPLDAVLINTEDVGQPPVLICRALVFLLHSIIKSQ